MFTQFFHTKAWDTKQTHSSQKKSEIYQNKRDPVPSSISIDSQVHMH